jgi:transposase
LRRRFGSMQADRHGRHAARGQAHELECAVADDDARDDFHQRPFGIGAADRALVGRAFARKRRRKLGFEVCEALAPLVVQLRNLDEAIARLDRIIAKLAQKDETARRLMTIPGFGPITASAMAATIQDASSFAGPREFAAFLGLTPKQNSSGGKQKLGRISKMGNRNLRKLLVVGAHAVLFHRKPHTDPLRMWAKKLIDKKPFKLVAVALANKMARIAFAIMRGKTVYREIPA